MVTAVLLLPILVILATVAIKVITASDNDGFLYNDALYVITNEQKEALLNYNTKEILEKENKQINYYKELIKNIEKHKLYHAQDVRKMKKQYNDIHNEGGEGYIPHFYTFEEYEYAKKQLAKLIKEQNK